jgi:putative restriction endonuclease
MSRIDRNYGLILGVQSGTVYASRQLLAKAGVHRPWVAGICGANDGAESVVISGGYEDDVDDGDEVLYTGQGGNESQGGGIQIKDQQWSGPNAGLAANAVNGHPVRLVRGPCRTSAYAPLAGYRYDGLYFVKRYWEETGKSGYRICRFLLVRDDAELAPWQAADSELIRPTQRRQGTVQRLIRNTEYATHVKKLHCFKCQICQTSLHTPGGLYAEGAHIRPLGKPHNGPDAVDNILCLCPNHHVLFDAGAFGVQDDGTLIGIDGSPNELREHRVNRDNLRYHALHIARLRTSPS